MHTLLQIDLDPSTDGSVGPTGVHSSSDQVGHGAINQMLPTTIRVYQE
jgi:hypothetical protein